MGEDVEVTFEAVGNTVLPGAKMVGRSFVGIVPESERPGPSRMVEVSTGEYDHDIEPRP